MVLRYIRIVEAAVRFRLGPLKVIHIPLSSFEGFCYNEFVTKKVEKNLYEITNQYEYTNSPIARYESTNLGNRLRVD